MSDAFTNFLSNKGYGPTLRDYQHASKLYVDGVYSRSPKVGFLYFVNLKLNPITFSSNFNDEWNVNDFKDVGLLAKKVDLPKFSIENETINQYNRKTVVQKSIKYNPISISLHDDNKDISHNLWVNYYKNYYQDGRFNPNKSFQDTKFGTTNYEYGRYDNNLLANFFDSIDIYVLHMHKFTKYTIVNPKITEWTHDSLDQSTGNKVMENKLTIAYESVIYDYGKITGSEPEGWSARYYDKEPSPNSIAGIGSNDVVYRPRGQTAFDQKINVNRRSRVTTAGQSIFDQKTIAANIKSRAIIPSSPTFDQQQKINSKSRPIETGYSSFDQQTGKDRVYGNFRPKPPGMLEQLGTILLKNYVNSNGLTRQNSVVYNIAGSVMKQTLSSGAGKYAEPPSTETAPGVFNLPGGIGINVFKAFNTTVDGGIRANPAAILFPPKQ